MMSSWRHHFGDENADEGGNEHFFLLLRPLEVDDGPIIIPGDSRWWRDCLYYVQGKEQQLDSLDVNDNKLSRTQTDSAGNQRRDRETGWDVKRTTRASYPGGQVETNQGPATIGDDHQLQKEKKTEKNMNETVTCSKRRADLCLLIAFYTTWFLT